MYFLALAADYDGTLAEEGTVSTSTLAALRDLKESGRKLIMVTGRELPDLKRVFGELKMFDRVVVENGALLYNPATEEERPLGPPPPEVFIAMLEDRKVAPISVGRSIVATWEPHEKTVLDTIRDLGLELQIVFNKGAVMVLPAGVNKATGLAAALEELGLSFHNVVAVGDAENDHAFLKACGCSAAVANALAMVKESADIALAGARGAGVAELIELILKRDAGIIPPERHGLAVGTYADETIAYLEPHRGSVLIAGSSGIGKSTLATALTERMVERKFEFCIFDPEGDYDGLEDAIVVGEAKAAPELDEVLQLLHKPDINVAINTQALEVAERPGFFAGLMPQISSLRAKTGRPHWLIIDEAHHLMPGSKNNVSQSLPKEVPATILITVHPDRVAPEALRSVQTVIALGDSAGEVLSSFAEVVGIKAPGKVPRLSEDEVLFWQPRLGKGPRPLKATRPRQAHKRHTRKYAEGQLDEDQSFYFRGPDNALNLRAQNLMLFDQIASGVDDRTWEHHLRQGDYSHWFKTVIKDDKLAEMARAVEMDKGLDARESRRRISEVVRQHYTAPAKGE